jgi:hypothetical protein
MKTSLAMTKRLDLPENVISALNFSGKALFETQGGKAPFETQGGRRDAF